MLKRTQMTLITSIVSLGFSLPLFASTNHAHSTAFPIASTGFTIHIPSHWLQHPSFKRPHLISLHLQRKNSLYPNLNIFLYPNKKDPEALLQQTKKNLKQLAILDKKTIKIGNTVFYTSHSAWSVNRKLVSGRLTAYRYSGYIPNQGTLFISCVDKAATDSTDKNMATCQRILSSLHETNPATQTMIPFPIAQTGLQINIPHNWQQPPNFKRSGLISIHLKNTQSLYPNLNIFLYPQYKNPKQLLLKTEKFLSKITIVSKKHYNIGPITVYTLHSTWHHSGYLQAYRYAAYIPHQGTLYITCVDRDGTPNTKDHMAICHNIVTSLRQYQSKDNTDALRSARHHDSSQ